MQIRTRLTVQFSLLVSGILLVTFLAVYFFTYYNVTEDFYDRLRSKAKSQAELLLKVQVPLINAEVLKALDETNRDLIYDENIFIFDEKNRLIYSNSTTPQLKALHVSNYWLDEIRKAGQIRYDDGDYKVVGLYYKYPFNKAVVMLGAKDLYGQANLSNLKTLLTVLYLVVTFVVAIVGWIFSKRALRPISKVMNAVEGILPQKLDTRLNVPNQKDEIGRLTITFNKLLDRIETAFQMQKIFVANVSHELKNPLTKIKSQLEVSMLKERNPAEYQMTIRSVLEDIQELGQLSNTLLELAKVSEDQRDLLTELIRVDDLLLDCRMNLAQANPAYNIQLNFDELPEDDTWLEITGNSTLLKTAFLNLMDNACKFSDDNAVNVCLLPSRGQLGLTFSDNGKGIPDKDKSLVFQPFYRSDNTANIKGYGIGLSLVERIVKLHNGSISIQSNVPKGTTFRLTFLRL
ncbi:signal transduction histidine kinase [Dyadobacter sp. BE34]|uniref:histidine kinase n=1 Tax=Dyadobacter fermentans TaxID=94254 RepID=A0ABU1QZB7_9BACT|nr:MULTISPECIES: HAMP domain-containing sensor histidine kinase [Dyadobacter]MBZ1361735.1 HAMP domain-containing histidine kinase [Dyadobacter fermentans]MDR6806461.1 signal transduction histidine kinase [Dyadobacter fermentans]MDR7044202.1 signal transduction histidine kinase [Dyadobacter sp. BE242]MDR7198513.1 signal transduction histidine kinase [Dyadobacter sp. BE34]MDR7216475.1 signal transduction histidine kinase [Dyadobacter sp. BE31]